MLWPGSEVLTTPPCTYCSIIADELLPALHHVSFEQAAGGDEGAAPVRVSICVSGRDR